jgi:hypothetical protein
MDFEVRADPTIAHGCPSTDSCIWKVESPEMASNAAHEITTGIVDPATAPIFGAALGLPTVGAKVSGDKRNESKAEPLDPGLGAV